MSILSTRRAKTRPKQRARLRLGRVTGLALVGTLLGSLTGVIGALAPASAASATDPILTVAGGNGEGFEDDGFSATRAFLRGSSDVAVDRAGNLYIASDGGIRKVDTTGIITTIGPPATCVLPDPAGGVYFCTDLAVQHVDAAGTVTTFAGNGEFTGPKGDGGPATQAPVTFPRAVALGRGGELYIAATYFDPDTFESSEVLRKVDTHGTITSVPLPTGVYRIDADTAGNIYLASNTTVNKLDPTTGAVTRLAGTGESPPGREQIVGLDGPALQATINVQDVAVDAAGTVYMFAAFFVVKLDASGILTRVAGVGIDGTGNPGDGGPAGQAVVVPVGLDTDASGAVFFPQSDDNNTGRVRRVGPERLALSESHAPAGVVAGQEVTFTYTVRNLAPTASTNVVLTDARTTTLALVASKSPGCLSNATTITCAVGTIPAGGSKAVTLTFQATAAGAVNRTTKVTSAEPDPYVQNNLLSYPTLVSASLCGRTITSNTELVADLGPCEGTAIIVGADNVTLDLKGKTVFGFPGPSGPAGNQAGVRIVNRRGVTVKNGTIRDFDGGIHVINGSHHTITGITARDNIGPDNIFEAALGDGILIESTSNTVIRGNTFVHNGKFDGIGVYGPEANDNLIQDNLVAENIGPSSGGQSGQGIILNASTAGPVSTVMFRNRILHNVVRDNASGGISNINHIAGQIADNVVDGNGRTNAAGNGIGVQVGPRWSRNDPMRMVLQGNQVRGNGDDGIQLRRSALGNTILGNTATGNGLRSGLDLRDFNFNCGTNVWHGNKWGSAGFSPDCTAIGGSGPAPVASAKATAASPSTAAAIAAAATTELTVGEARNARAAQRLK